MVHNVIFLALVAMLGFGGCSQRSDRVAAVAIHPTKTNIIYVATEEGVYKTRDGGAGWERLTEGLSRIRVMNLVIDPLLPANVFAGTLADGVYKSPDGGRRWLPRNAGIQKGTISANVNQLVFHPADTQILFAATTVGIFRSLDGGESWTERMRGMNEINFVVALAIDPEHHNIMYAGTSGGVYRSFDGSENWVKINNGLVPGDAKMASMALGVNQLLIDPSDTKTVYAGTTKGLFKTSNKGMSWTKIVTGLGDPYVSSLLVNPQNTLHLYMGTSEGIFESLDGGLNWEPRQDGLGNLNIRVLAMDPKDPKILYCGTNGGGLFKSNNGAGKWNSVPLTIFQPS
ncbi:hypothetical protein [Candidatus Nitronereus thalassa]|uniref:Sortilin N-terminal domain-containing protein n=1 Tax=Candidatus Nitronereus thalassa TaxID=3020898 RepID=A0ABU3K7T6_9BACT|nr:hypothetical protein [Candidatus Nitronereus thalassa]MDT7042461.1 hypothetical protein [Candidatus Nitronereus thalassa]